MAVILFNDCSMKTPCLSNICLFPEKKKSTPHTSSVTRPHPASAHEKRKIGGGEREKRGGAEEREALYS